MTDKHYAELRLYFGLCDSGGLSEGPFVVNSNSRFANERFNWAMRRVNEGIEPGLKYSTFHFGCWDHLVRTEEEARVLVDYAEKNIPRASGGIQLEYVMHGKMSFWRRIVFDEWENNQKTRLVHLLKKSGFVPRDERVESLERQLNINKKDETLCKLIREELAKVDFGRRWSECLKFY